MYCVITTFVMSFHEYHKPFSPPELLLDDSDVFFCFFFNPAVGRLNSHSQAAREARPQLNRQTAHVSRFRNGYIASDFRRVNLRQLHGSNLTVVSLA